MDIQGSSFAADAAATEPARAGAFESAATERREVEEAASESQEFRRSSTEEGVGEQVDIEA